MRRIDFEARLRAKAWHDEEFQERLLADPKATVKAELSEIEGGVNLPDNVRVRVIEEDAEEICVVIPKHPEHSAGRALSPEELAAVAGGASSSDVQGLPAAMTALDACAVTTCMDPVGILSVIVGTSAVIAGSD